MKRQRAITVVNPVGALHPHRLPHGLTLTLKLSHLSYNALQQLSFDRSGRHLLCIDHLNKLIVLDCKLQKYCVLAQQKDWRSTLVVPEWSGVRMKVMVGRASGQVCIYSQKGGQWESALLNFNSNEITSMDFNQHRNLYLLTDMTQLFLVDAHSMKVRASLYPFQDKFLRAIFTPSSQAIILLTQKGSFRCHAISDLQLLDQHQLGERVTKDCKIVGKEGSQVLILSQGKSVFLYNLELKQMKRFRTRLKIKQVESLSSGSFFFLTDENSVVFWDPLTLDTYRVCKQQQCVLSMAVSEEEDCISLGSSLGKVWMYRLEQLMCLKQIQEQLLQQL